MIAAMTPLTIIITVSLVLAGSYAVLYLIQHLSIPTGDGRLRFQWQRLRLAVAEMNYATRRMVELQEAPLPGSLSNH